MVNKGGKANINLAFIIRLPVTVTTTAEWQVGLFFSADYNKNGRLLLNAYLFSFSFFDLVSLP